MIQTSMIYDHFFILIEHEKQLIKVIAGEDEFKDYTINYFYEKYSYVIPGYSSITAINMVDMINEIACSSEQGWDKVMHISGNNLFMVVDE